jgi:hypothetical protein
MIITCVLKTKECRAHDFMLFVSQMIAAASQAKQPQRQQEKAKLNLLGRGTPTSAEERFQSILQCFQHSPESPYTDAAIQHGQAMYTDAGIWDCERGCKKGRQKREDKVPWQLRHYRWRSVEHPSSHVQKTASSFNHSASASRAQMSPRKLLSTTWKGLGPRNAGAGGRTCNETNASILSARLDKLSGAEAMTTV